MRYRIREVTYTRMDGFIEKYYRVQWSRFGIFWCSSLCTGVRPVYGSYEDALKVIQGYKNREVSSKTIKYYEI